MKKIVSVLTEAASDIERGIDFYEAIEEINDSKNILIISVSCNFAIQQAGLVSFGVLRERPRLDFAKQIPRARIF